MTTDTVIPGASVDPADPVGREAFRAAMAAVCTPVSVATTLQGERPYGTTVSAFSSLSLDPPMILVALDRRSDLLTAIRSSARFGLNVLSSSQAGLARTFARRGGPAKFTGIPWQHKAGVPSLPGVGSFVACVVADLVEAGDHVLVLGRVVHTETSPQPPLAYHDRTFGTHLPLP